MTGEGNVILSYLILSHLILNPLSYPYPSFRLYILIYFFYYNSYYLHYSFIPLPILSISDYIYILHPTYGLLSVVTTVPD
jgi:hypothetical protein